MNSKQVIDKFCSNSEKLYKVFSQLKFPNNTTQTADGAADVFFLHELVAVLAAGGRAQCFQALGGALFVLASAVLASVRVPTRSHGETPGKFEVYSLILLMLSEL